MIANNDMNRWCALYTAPRSERKLMQRLNEAGYAAFCPMQIVFRKWNGKTKEVFTPLFPGFLFVEETADVASFVASQNVALLVDAEGKRLSVCAEKAELAAEFGLSGNFWLVSFKISYLCLPLFYEPRTTPSCHPSGCAYRQL